MPGLLSFPETKKLLEKYSLPLVATIATSSASELYTAFASMKKPVAVKASGPSVLHKTEKGLVFLNVSHGEQLEQAVKAISAGAGGSFQFLMQQQLSGAELIVGGKRDASFGPVVLFGTGGIYAELLDDVSIRVVPLYQKDAREMIYETKARKFIEGFRSRKMDEEQMVDLLLKTSELMEKEENVVELDFNPVIATETQAWIVDARVLVGK